MPLAVYARSIRPGDVIGKKQGPAIIVDEIVEVDGKLLFRGRHERTGEPKDLITEPKDLVWYSPEMSRGDC